MKDRAEYSGTLGFVFYLDGQRYYGVGSALDYLLTQWGTGAFGCASHEECRMAEKYLRLLMDEEELRSRSIIAAICAA